MSSRAVVRSLTTVLLGATVLVGGLPSLPVAADPASVDGREVGPDSPAPGKAAAAPSFGTRAPQDAAAPGSRSAAEAPALERAPVTTANEIVTPTSRAVRNADGTWTAQIYQQPVFRKQADGKRVKADSKQLPGTDSDTALDAPDAYVPLKFGKKADRLVRFDLAKGKVTLGLNGVTLPQPVLQPDGRLLYRDVALDTDLLVGQAGPGVRTELILRSARAPRAFTFTLADPSGALGDGKKDSDGSFVFDEEVDDAVRMVVGSPFAYEKDPAFPDGPFAIEPGSASMTVEKQGKTYLLTKTVDAEWAAGRTYPIVLDPTITFTSIAATTTPRTTDRVVQTRDCHLVSPSVPAQTTNTASPVADRSYCGTFNEVGWGSGTDTNGSYRRMLHRFDTSIIPVDSTVGLARLNLLLIQVDQGATSVSASVFEAGQLWTETAPQPTWNRPQGGATTWATSAGGPVGAALGSAVTLNNLATSTNKYYAWTVTPAAQKWVNTPGSNFGVVTRMTTETATASVARLASKEDTFAERKAPYLEVSYTPPANPAITKTVLSPTATDANSLLASALQAGTGSTHQVAVGQKVTYRVTVNNTAPHPRDITVVDPVVSGLQVLPATVRVGSSIATLAACPSALCSTPTSTNGLQLDLVNVPAAANRVVEYSAVAVGTSERGCAALGNTAFAYSQTSGANSATQQVVVCDRGLGLEPWWSYVATTETGPQGTAQVNAANGNLIVQQVDSTPVQGHGRLGFVLRRTYNSQDTALATLPGSIGGGWQLNFGEVGEALTDGLASAAISTPRVPDPLSTVPITLVDRDGTRHVFTPKVATVAPSSLLTVSSASSAGVVSTARSTLGSLVPDVLKPLSNRSLCLDLSYRSPPGVHVGLWRYLQVPGACGNATAANAKVMGFAAVRPDRFRSEYAADGRLVGQTDAAGNELRYQYTTPEPLETTGIGLGLLSRVVELPPSGTSTCTLAAPSSCRQFRFEYGPDGGLTTSQVRVTDPAGRPTVYTLNQPVRVDPNLASPLTARLLEVRNPDGSTLAHTYHGVSGASCGAATSGQLCSITDTRGTATTFSYTANSLLGGAARVTTVTDRRGTATTISYDSNGAGTSAVRGSNRLQRLSGIDAFGRAARLSDSDSRGTATTTDDLLLRQTDFGWDFTTGVSCRRPGPAVMDHNLCTLTRAQTGTVDAASRVPTSPRQRTLFEYTANGNPLRVQRTRTATDPAAGDLSGYDVSTYGYRSQYYRSASTGGAAFYLDDVRAGKTVASTGAARQDEGGSTLYSVEDRLQALSPIGNEQPLLATGETCAGVPACRAELTAWQVDAPSAYDAARLPNQRPANNLCDSGVPGANTGLPCSMTGPARADDNGTLRTPETRYSYDTFGQRITMTTPNVVAAPASGGRYTYTYYDDAARDLGGDRTAGGWLKAVTDPQGKFVVYGYDAAGNITRTWDRTATSKAGRGIADYPGSVTLPTSPDYSEALRPNSTDATQPYNNPWRYVLTTRDAVGSTSGSCVDRNGNAVITRPARGHVDKPLNCAVLTPNGILTTSSTVLAAELSPYDTIVGAATPDDQTSAVLTPEEAGRNRTAAPGRPDKATDGTDYRTVFGYNAFGELSQTVDPRGNYRNNTYDAVGRLVRTDWTRGTPSPLGPESTGAAVTAECAGSTLTVAADDLGSAGKVKCSSLTVFDGLNQVVAATDAAGARTDRSYDALGRNDRTVESRSATIGLTTRTVYDSNGRPVLTCPPRHYTEGTGDSGCALTAAPVERKHTTAVSYDPAGSVTATTSWRERSISFGTLSPQLSGIFTRHGYDLNGNMTLDVEPNALDQGSTTPRSTPLYRTTTSYDSNDRPTSTTRPRSTTSSFTDTVTYNPVGTARSSERATDGALRIRTSYSYDALNRVLDTVRAATSDDATATGDTELYQPGTGNNARTRVFYDRDGNIVATLEPRAFERTGARLGDGSTGPEDTSVTVSNPDLAYLTRTDFDLNGRAFRTFTPRYDNKSGSDSSNPTGGSTQAADCPLSNNLPAQPQTVPGAPTFPGTVGVCSAVLEYDVMGNVAASRAANSTGSDDRVRRYTYTDDNLLRTSQTAHPAGGSATAPGCDGQTLNGQTQTCYRYDGTGRATVYRDAKGARTVSTYNLDGTLVSTDRPDSTGPDPANPTSTATFTHVSTTTYNAAGQPLTSTNELGQTSASAYYSEGSPAEVGDTGGASTPGSPSNGVNITRYRYDPNGNPTHVTSPSAVGLNPSGGGAPIRDAQFQGAAATHLDTINTYTFDNLLAATHTPVQVANGGNLWRSATRTYDDAGRNVTTRTEESTLAFDANGALTAATPIATRSATTVTLGYDQLDRVTTQSGESSPIDDIRATENAATNTQYDAAGNTVRAVSSSGTAGTQVTNSNAATYYLDGLLRSTIDAFGTTNAGKATIHTYDGQGQRATRADGPVTTSLATPTSQTTTGYRYNQANLLDQVTDPAGTLTLGYDNAGRPVTQTNPNSTRLAWTYQDDDTVTQQTLTSSTTQDNTTVTTTLGTWDYAYDPLSRVTRQDFTGTGAAGAAGAPNPNQPGTLPTGSWAYNYDTAGRLASFTPAGGTSRNVEHDRNSNRLRYGTTTYTYRADDSINSTTSGATTNTYTHHAFGGISDDGCTQYRYDAFSRRLTATVPSGRPTECGQTSTSRYSYDGWDREVTHTSNRTTSQLPADTPVRAHYDGLSQAIAISSATNVIDPLGSVSDSRYVLDDSGSPLAITSGIMGQGAQWLTGDAQGNLTHATGTNGTVLCASRFDPYGTAINGSADSACASGTSINDVWWRGGRRDSASGQYQFGARTYDPNKGSWLTPDTMRTGGSAANRGLVIDPLTRNTYSYVNGDPVNLSDPSGHKVAEWGSDNKNLASPEQIAANEIAFAEADKRAEKVKKHEAKKARLTKQASADCELWQAGCLKDKAWAVAQLAAMAVDMDKLSAIAHTTLDVAGMIPVIGEAADGLNAVVYLAEGNKAMAAVSLAAMIPVAGNAVTGGKLLKAAAGGARKAADSITSGTTRAAVATKAVGGAVQAKATKGLDAASSAAKTKVDAVAKAVSIRKRDYPTRVRKATHERIETGATGSDGVIRCQNSACAVSGGRSLEPGEISPQHVPELNVTHNNLGFNVDQATRNDLYNDTATLGYCLPCQRAEGGSTSGTYRRDVGPNYQPRRSRGA